MTVVASNYARAANDLYQTEPWATEALLRHFPVFGVTVWEPAAGNHLMADVLRERGAKTAPVSWPRSPCLTVSRGRATAKPVLRIMLGMSGAQAASAPLVCFGRQRTQRNS
jgi:hypothetical protein